MNITLIGMPGCGKSTVGVVLAKVLGFDFIDTDLLIQSLEGRVLSRIIQEDGDERFRAVEEQVICALCCDSTVIATGGSAVYGEKAMAHARELGRIVYLRLSLESIRSRLGDLTRRGVSMTPGQTLDDLYRERVPLYERWADEVIDAEGKDIPAIVREIAQ